MHLIPQYGWFTTTEHDRSKTIHATEDNNNSLCNVPRETAKVETKTYHDIEKKVFVCAKCLGTVMGGWLD
jgi:hypothetical protein